MSLLLSNSCLAVEFARKEVHFENGGVKASEMHGGEIHLDPSGEGPET
jgi:hypothetical protein